MTERLNDLSLQADELSTACPQLTNELSALCSQLAACRVQIEGRSGEANNNTSATSGDLLLGISRALHQIQGALTNMKARVEALQQQQQQSPPPATTPSLTAT